MDWKQKLILLIGIAVAIVFAYFALQLLEPTEQKPSTILEDPGQNSIVPDSMVDDIMDRIF